MSEALTKKEIESLGILSSGKKYSEIAIDMRISINTVKKHLKNVYRKLNVKSRKEATEQFLSALN